MHSPMGTVSIVSNISDYREVDGIKVPFRMKIVLMGAQEMMTIMESVKFNVELPEGIFDEAAEIQELVAGDQPKAGDEW